MTQTTNFEIAHIILETRPGSTRDECIYEAVKVAICEKTNVLYVFNGEPYNVRYTDLLDCIKKTTKEYIAGIIGLE